MIDLAKVDCRRTVQELLDYCAGKSWTPVHYYRIPRIGWEMDHNAVIARDDKGKLRVVSTSHGGICEGSVDELRQDIELLEQALGEQKEALRLLEGT